MKDSLNRVWTIERINRSISLSHSSEQLHSTAHFLARYYETFAFDYNFFLYEWMLDTQLEVRRQRLDLLTDEEAPRSITHLPLQTRSLHRLDSFVRQLSVKELQAIWGTLQLQLRNINLSRYPQLCEKIACMRSTTGTYDNQYVRQTLRVA